MTTMTAEPITTLTWRRHAACADTDPELFFPLNSRSHEIERAIQICYRCPVRRECLDDTLSLPAPMLHVGMVAGGRYFLTKEQHMTSTNPRGPIMSSRYWPVEPGRCETGGCIRPTRHGQHVAFTSDQNPHGQLRGMATLDETRKFFDEVKAGLWDRLVAGDE